MVLYISAFIAFCLGTPLVLAGIDMIVISKPVIGSEIRMEIDR